MELFIEALDVVAIVTAGLMVGNELSVAMLVHPALDRLPDAAHQPTASALARVMGRFMPFWYILVLLLTLAGAFVHWRHSGRFPVWIGASAVLWILVIVGTVTTMVPINNRIASWEKAGPPADWKTFRRKWDLLHRWRVAFLTIALTFLIVGVSAAANG